MKGESHNESRYVSVDEIARQVYEQYLLEQAREDFGLMCNPRVQHLIWVRATISDAFCFQIMKDVYQ